MIRPLRVRHRIAAALMAIGLPLLFLSALVARQPPRTMASPPGPTVEDLSAWVRTGFQDQMLGLLPMRWNQIGDGDPPVRAGIELLRSAPVNLADPLLYWSVERPDDEWMLPAAAYLVGAVGPDEVQRLALPEDALLQNGWLFLYSLAHQEVVARAVWPSLVFIDEGAAP